MPILNKLHLLELGPTVHQVCSCPKLSNARWTHAMGYEGKFILLDELYYSSHSLLIQLSINYFKCLSLIFFRLEMFACVETDV